MIVVILRVTTLVLFGALGFLSASFIFVFAEPLLFINVEALKDYEAEYFSIPDVQRILGVYLLSVCLIWFTPGLVEFMMDFALRQHRLNEQERQAAKIIEEDLRCNCDERRVYYPPIKWRKSNAGTFNAAYGRNRITLTSDLYEAVLSGNEHLKQQTMGVAAHELGHLYHNDTKFLALIYVMSWPVYVFSLALRLIGYFVYVIAAFSQTAGIMSLGMYAYNLILWFITWFTQIPAQMTAHTTEFRADRFSFYLGYGAGIRDFLHAHLHLDQPAKFEMGRIMSTHPATWRRIEHLDELKRSKNVKRPVRFLI